MAFLPGYPYTYDKNTINLEINKQDERILYFERNITADNLLSDVSLTFDLEQLAYTLHYGYSLDGDNWSPFYFDFQLFMTLVNEQATDGFPTFIRVKVMVSKEDERNYHVLSNNSKIIQISGVQINGAPARIEKVEIPFANNIIKTRKAGSLWSPYNGMEKGTSIWKNLSMAVNNVVGLQVYYFKVAAQQKGKSISLKSYRVKNVVDMKKINVLVPDNYFPDNTNIFSEYGITFADEMTLHIVDEAFIEAFGREVGTPEQNDFLYFPLTDRMYEVNNAFPAKGFMQQYTWWQANLLKYEERETVIKQTEEIDYSDSINGWIGFADSEAFQEAEKEMAFEEVQAATPDYYNTDIIEATRSQLHKDLDIVAMPMRQGATQLFKYWYRLSLVTKDLMAVTYKARDKMPDNMCFSFWVLQESRSRKKLFVVTDDLDQNWLECTFVDNGITVTDLKRDEVILRSTVELSTKMKYCVAVNWSNQYNFASLLIMTHNDQTGTTDVTDFVTKTDNYTYPNPVRTVNIFGGQQLISAFTLRTKTLDEGSVKNMILTPQPNSTDVVFHDKCEAVGENVRSRL